MGTATITISGTLSDDPDVRTTAKGTTVVNLKVPTHQGWGDKEVTTWWRCTLFGKQAEQAAQPLKGGSNVLLAGEPRLTKWQGRDGDDRYSPEVVCTMWRFGPKVKQQRADDSPKRRKMPDFADGDMPF